MYLFVDSLCRFFQLEWTCDLLSHKYGSDCPCGLARLHLTILTLVGSTNLLSGALLDRKCQNCHGCTNDGTSNVDVVNLEAVAAANTLVLY